MIIICCVKPIFSVARLTQNLTKKATHRGATIANLKAAQNATSNKPQKKDKPQQMLGFGTWIIIKLTKLHLTVITRQMKKTLFQKQIG
ncbi:MAG TPA: hypothetical protein PKC44_12175 [Agitococcus sp.]|nr:hypothetical protein [Agitococcus sp.]